MQYDLVFEGGGAKGMAFVGALEAFEAQGHTYGRLLGASAGAITAAFLAAGYSSAEMMGVLGEKRNGRPVFTEFMGTPAGFSPQVLQDSILLAFLRSIDLPLIPDFVEEKLDQTFVAFLARQPRYRHLLSLIEFGGWFSADPFVSWLTEKLNSGTWQGEQRHFGAMSLSEFFEATAVELTVVASDTTDGRLLVLNHHTAPDCPLVWAVRMSMNIPLLWQEVVWQAQWGTYRGKNVADHAIVDGGLLSNFPIELYVSNLSGVTEVMGPKTDASVLGFLIDETLAVPGIEMPVSQKKGLSVTDLRPIQRLLNLVETVLQGRDKMVLDALERLVVRLPAHSYGTTEFDMTDDRREALVNAGRQAMQAYLASTAAISTLSFDHGAPSGAVPLGRDTARLANKIATRLLE